MRKKGVLLFVMAVLLFSLFSFSASAGLGATIGNKIDSAFGSLASGKEKIATGSTGIVFYDKYQEIIDFAIIFTIFLSISYLGLSKWMKQGGNAAIGLSIAIGAALALAFIKAGLSISFFWPFAKNALFFILFLVVFFLLKQEALLGKHTFWAFIIALVTTWLLFNMTQIVLDPDKKLNFAEIVGIPTAVDKVGLAEQKIVKTDADILGVLAGIDKGGIGTKDYVTSYEEAIKDKDINKKGTILNNALKEVSKVKGETDPTDKERLKKLDEIYKKLNSFGDKRIKAEQTKIKSIIQARPTMPTVSLSGNNWPGGRLICTASGSSIGKMEMAAREMEYPSLIYVFIWFKDNKEINRKEITATGGVASYELSVVEDMVDSKVKCRVEAAAGGLETITEAISDYVDSSEVSIIKNTEMREEEEANEAYKKALDAYQEWFALSDEERGTKKDKYLGKIGAATGLLKGVYDKYPDNKDRGNIKDKLEKTLEYSEDIEDKTAEKKKTDEDRIKNLAEEVVNLEEERIKLSQQVGSLEKEKMTNKEELDRTKEGLSNLKISINQLEARTNQLGEASKEETTLLTDALNLKDNEIEKLEERIGSLQKEVPVENVYLDYQKRIKEVKSEEDTKKLKDDIEAYILKNQDRLTPEKKKDFNDKLLEELAKKGTLQERNKKMEEAKQKIDSGDYSGAAGILNALTKADQKDEEAKKLQEQAAEKLYKEALKLYKGGNERYNTYKKTKNIEDDLKFALSMYEEASATFEKILDYKDSTKRNQEAQRRITEIKTLLEGIEKEEQKEVSYKEAIGVAKKGHDAYDEKRYKDALPYFEDASKKYEGILGYKESQSRYDAIQTRMKVIESELGKEEAKIPEEKKETRLQEGDLNNDGTVTEEEAKKWDALSTGNEIHVADLNGDGYLNEEEVSLWKEDYPSSIIKVGPWPPPEEEKKKEAETPVPQQVEEKNELTLDNGQVVAYDRIDTPNGWAYGYGESAQTPPYVNVRISTDTGDVWEEVPAGKNYKIWQKVRKIQRR